MRPLYRRSYIVSGMNVRTWGLDLQFVMCELTDMPDTQFTVADLRTKELKLTLEQFAQQLGLKSKGQAKAINDGGRCSVAVALRIEALSGGRIPASSLNPDIALLENARGIAA